MKIISTSSLFGSCIAASAIAMSLGVAQAADPAPVKTPSFNQLDTNHDGYIDSKEAAGSLEVSGWLSSADKDKDGRLSPGEFSAAQSSVGIENKPYQK
ncbi:MAG: Secreted protein acidic and rich in cysteine Ca binding region [Rhodocyclales bacterium]|nr:Secreted protein acidic and rich in cysteine Ca binding region [Rhodocyclales bacterium]